jgi:hydroxymethylbilane synthase
MKTLTLISRKSKLALWQANYVKEQLLGYYPQLRVLIKGISTAGDRILDRSLDKIGGKGLFVKELEQQLLNGAADIAVHSLKDMPAILPSGLSLAAILKREDPEDGLLAKHFTSLDQLPPGSIIGTSSARRIALLRYYYPHLVSRFLRGNVQTRLDKLDKGEYTAIILAVAGLKRLGLAQRISQVLAPDKFIPAIGQGALALEVCSQRKDLIDLLQILQHAPTAICVSAERELGRFLQASCNLPLAGFARLSANDLTLEALLADNSNGQIIWAKATGAASDPAWVGRSCAEQLLENGAASILQRYQLTCNG